MQPRIISAQLEYRVGPGWRLLVGCTTHGGVTVRRRAGFPETIKPFTAMAFQRTGNRVVDDQFETFIDPLSINTPIRLVLDVQGDIDAEVRLVLDETPEQVIQRRPVHRSVSFDATSNSQTENAASLSWSHTCSGSNRGLLIGSGNWDDDTFSQHTYNSVALTLERTDGDTTTTTSRIGSLIAPATGSNTATVEFSVGTPDIVAGALSVTGANQTDLVTGATGSTGTAQVPSDTVTSDSNDLVFDNLSWWDGTPMDPSVGASQTERWENRGTSDEFDAGSTEPGAASVTMSWDLGEEVWGWAHSACNIEAAPAAGGALRSLALLGVGS